MSPDDARHGTRAGAQAHRKEGEKPCDPCRLAWNDYHRRLRQDPDFSADERRKNNARTRALWRLAAAHPEEFHHLYLSEVGPPVLATADPSP